MHLIYNKYKKELWILLALIFFGQLVFAIYSPTFTKPRYEGRIYATTGAKHRQEDLHALNDAAHYFGQTMIGWLKFPHFLEDMKKITPLPVGASISAHIQEKQNIIFTVASPAQVELETLKKVKDFIQAKMDVYNRTSDTNFALTNLDYEQVEIKRGYVFGAMVTLIASCIIALGFIFVRREFA